MTSFNTQYLSFEEAREFVRKLKIRTTRDWERYCIGALEEYEKKPDYIPRSPELVYRRVGWVNYKDWLNESLMNFDKAKDFVINLGLNNKQEWLEYCQNKYPHLPIKPNNIPRDPDIRYRKEWKNWEDWLTGNTLKISGQWRDFKEAREYVRKLGIKNTLDWRKYCKGELSGYNKKPEDIPVAADYAYRDEGWINYGDWLGTNIDIKIDDNISWLSYNEAKKFIHFLNLKSILEWFSYTNGEILNLPLKPENIPDNPSIVYKNNGWIGYSDWLGLVINNTIVEQYRSFEEAREFVRNLGIKTLVDWKKYCINELDGYEKKPYDIPSYPDQIYRKEGWISFKDWLFEKQLHYVEAKKFVKQLNLKNKEEWIKYCKGKFNNLPKKPINIPEEPDLKYIYKGWKNWYDFLGVEKYEFKYLNFYETKRFVQLLKLSSKEDWCKYCNNQLKNFKQKPDYIPTNPNEIYKNNWISWEDFLGIARDFRNQEILLKSNEISIDNFKKEEIQYLSFEQARNYIHKINFTSVTQWEIFKQLKDFPAYIPLNPASEYFEKGWKNIYDWLNIKLKRLESSDFESSRKFAQKLNLNSEDEWFKYVNGLLKIEYIKDCVEKNDYDFNIPLKYDSVPINLEKYPQNFFNKWTSWEDFLGIKNNTDNNSLLESKQIMKYDNQVEGKEFVIIDDIKYLDYPIESKEYLNKNETKTIPKSPHEYYSNINWDEWLKKTKLKEISYDKLCEITSFTLDELKIHFKKLGFDLSNKYKFIEKNIAHKIIFEILRSKKTSTIKDEVFTKTNIDRNSKIEYKKQEQYLTFEKAKEFVHHLNFDSITQWQIYNQSKDYPNFLPHSPSLIYLKEGWTNIYDWLNIKNTELNFNDNNFLKDFVHKLNLKSKEEWFDYTKGKLRRDYITDCINKNDYKSKTLLKYDSLPDNLNKNPHLNFDNWTSWEDFLGIEKDFSEQEILLESNEISFDNFKKEEIQYLSFDKARNFIRKLGLKNQIEWKLYCKETLDSFEKKPSYIPSDPKSIYENDGWIDYFDWLGINDDSPNVIPSFVIENLINEYKNNSTIIKILSFLSDNSNSKSIIEFNLNENDISEIEKILFQFRCESGKITQTKKAFIGLIFLTYVYYKLEPKLKYTSIWKEIINDFEEYSKVTRHFIDSYFTNKNYPNHYLRESIEYACSVFNLRNNFDSKDEHQYLRNTILLQIGLLNGSFNYLKLWLSNYNLPVIVSELLDVDSQNYSKEFNDGWRVLRRFRDNILSNDQAKNILTQNIWFKHLNLDELLKASKQRAKKQLMITQDENLPIFYLEKINYSDDGLSFTINAQDLYSLNLSGFRYEIFIDDEYKGVLIANNSKELILESPITIFNPDTNQIDLELRNEDDDVVFATEIVLFDFSEQMVLFDEDGNIYQNIFKKLNAHKKYHILMDSDLDCDFNKDSQREYFDGYATLVPFSGYKDNCKITYNDEILFELNFTENVEKPEFIDQLVLYTTANPSFILDNEYSFELKIMPNDFNVIDDLKNLPQEAKIIKWSYLGGYADSDDIENNSTINSKLYPEMIISPKHTLLIKYKSKVFKKVVYCNFFEKQNQYRLFQLGSDTTVKLVDKTSYLTKYALRKYKFFLSKFRSSNELELPEKVFIKNKSNFYQTVRLNKIINFAKFDGFGETISISEYLFYSPLIKIFNYSNSDEYISINQTNKNEINIHKELPKECKLILLDENLKEFEFSYQQIQKSIKNDRICLDNELTTALIIHGNSIIDSSYNYRFLDSFYDYNNTEVIKNLLATNYPFLSSELHIKFLRKFILNNIDEFCNMFYSDRIAVNENLLRLDFSKINILIEHIMFGLKIDADMSEQILQKLILNKKEKLLLETPIVLFNLLLSSNSRKLIKYFYNLVIDAIIEDERDESFIESIINNLFDTEKLNSIQKHNLKVEMHYVNGKYYLKKALEKLNG